MTFSQALPHHCLLGSALLSYAVPADHRVPSVSFCQHVKPLQYLSIILDPIFQVKSSKLQMVIFFFLEITESWGNFVVSRIKKRTSDVIQHLLNMNMWKEQPATQPPIQQRREGFCFAVKVTHFRVRECVQFNVSCQHNQKSCGKMQMKKATKCAQLCQGHTEWTH